MERGAGGDSRGSDDAHRANRGILLRAVYAYLVSSYFAEEDPEGDKGKEFRDDQIWLDRLAARRPIRVQIRAGVPGTEEWYARNGFDVAGGVLTLSWDNYRKVCGA